MNSSRLLLPLSVLAAAPAASAGLPPIEVAVTSDLTFASEYVFRGIEFADRSFQPSVELEAGQFYAGLWANLPIENRELAETELNYYGGYTIEIPAAPIEIDLGLVTYHFPDTSSKRTHEIFVGASADGLPSPGMTASVYYFYDLDLHTHVAEASVGYEWDLSGFLFPATLLASSIHGGLQGQARDKSESYHYYGASAELAHRFAETAMVTAGIHYGTAEKYTFDAAGGERGQNLFWTLSLTGTF